MGATDKARGLSDANPGAARKMVLSSWTIYSESVLTGGGDTAEERRSNSTKQFVDAWRRLIFYHCSYGTQRIMETGGAWAEGYAQSCLRS